MNRPSPAGAAPISVPAGVTLAVLAGGAGSRMGQPKGSLEIDGCPILVHLLERLAWPGPTLLVTSPGREHPPGWERFDREVADPTAGEGPLRGVQTALERATTAIVVVTVVDMPAVTRGQLEWLAGELAATPDSIALMTRHDAHVEPFPSAYRRDAADLATSLLSGGCRAVHAMCRDVRVATRESPDWPAGVWTNLNGPTDLAAYMHARQR